MNFVDVLIILLLLLAIFRGYQVGFLQSVFSSVGFIGGLLLGSLAAKQIAPHFSGALTKLIVIIAVELVLAFMLALVGELAGTKLSARVAKWRLNKANQILGAVLEMLFSLAAIWLIASALVNVQNANIGHDVKRSFIIQKLDNLLPRPPDVLAELEKIISPNGFPNVFLGLEPQHTTISPTSSVNNQAVLNDEKSVVKIQGAGCGGIVNGSGFVVAKGVVVTNAHVVAGITHPQVVDQSGTHQTVVTGFDPNMDIAVLHVTHLSDPPLNLANQILPNSDAAAILGYPGGGPLVANNAVIIDHVAAAGRNIYNQGITFRNIYEVQTDVEPGDSGGPLLAPDGSVAGVVFSKSLSQNNVGYALLIDQIKPLITQAEQQNSPVSTGSCAVG